MKTFRIGIVNDTAVVEKGGIGGHGSPTAFLGLPNVDIVALADSNSIDIEKRLAMTGAKKHYVDYHEMLEKEHLDIVVLCSRLPNTHFEQIRAAAAVGCSVFVEKPLSADLEDCDRMVDVCEKGGVKVAVAHLARYALNIQTAKAMVESGAIGRPLTFYGRGKEDDRGGGEDLIVLGTHILDIATYIFGPPQSVYADVQSEGRRMTAKDLKVPTEDIGLIAGDDILAHFKFANGVNGIFESRKGLFDGVDNHVRMGFTIEGTKGRLSVRYNSNIERTLRVSHSGLPLEDEAAYEIVPLKETRVIPGAQPIVYGVNPAKIHVWFLDANRFAAWDLMQALDEGRQPLSSIYDARMALEMIEGVYASHLAGRMIELPLKERRHPLAN